MINWEIYDTEASMLASQNRRNHISKFRRNWAEQTDPDKGKKASMRNMVSALKETTTEVGDKANTQTSVSKVQRAGTRRGGEGQSG